LKNEPPSLGYLRRTLVFPEAIKMRVRENRDDFLGVRLGNGQITIDPSKIAGIKEWPRTLKSVKEVQSTLGVLGF